MYYTVRNLSLDGNTGFKCQWCGKIRQYSEGYYYKPSSECSYCVCLQCAGNEAEKQINEYESLCKTNGTIEAIEYKSILLGTPPLIQSNNENNNNNNDIIRYGFKTALCVFGSQRQASKCVHVRSRLSFEGAFTTHFHHYSKIKKEIVLSMKLNSQHLSSVQLSSNSNNHNKNDISETISSSYNDDKLNI